MLETHPDAGVEVDHLKLELSLTDLIYEYREHFACRGEGRLIVTNKIGNKSAQVSIEEKIESKFPTPPPGFRITGYLGKEKDEPLTRAERVWFNTDLVDYTSTKPLVQFMRYLLERYEGSAKFTVRNMEYPAKVIKAETLVYVKGVLQE